MKEWTPQDSKRLASYKYIVDNDNIRIKEIIKQKLLANDDIIHVLDNKELQESDAENDEYFWVNIFPVYMVNPTQTDSQNFICFTVGYENIEKNFTNSNRKINDLVRHLHIVFNILCEYKNLKEPDTGIARHDLLAALITNEFNFTNFFGRKVQLLSDREIVVDAKYASRELVFTMITDNNVAQTPYGQPARLVTKEVRL